MSMGSRGRRNALRIDFTKAGGITGGTLALLQHSRHKGDSRGGGSFQWQSNQTPHRELA